MHNYKKIILPVLCILLLLAGSGYLLFRSFHQDNRKTQAYEDLKNKQYKSLFLSMYDVSTFSEDFFRDYLGVPTSRFDYCLQSAADINDALETAYASGNTIEHVFLGIDPLALWKAQKRDFSAVLETFENGWFQLAEAHPETKFEILFSFPSMDYWRSQKQEDVSSFTILTRQLTDIIGNKPNTLLHYVGGEEWLIGNTANYVSFFTPNDAVARKLFLLTFCDRNFLITPADAEAKLGYTQALIESYLTDAPVYPNLTNCDIIFFGDSIIGNYSGSLSIPGVINALSSANVYNCAIGGMAAAKNVSTDIHFAQMVQDFLAGETTCIETNLEKGILDYQTADHSGKNTVFLVEFGLNDYLLSNPLDNPDDPYDVTTYVGALRTGINTLQKKYPDATIVMMGPGNALFADGTDRRDKKGGALMDYYHSASALAEELHLPYIDLYQGFPEGSFHLEDVIESDCHYNESGRFLLGRKIVSFLANLLP